MEKYQLYEHAMERSVFAFAYHRIELDESGKPLDYVFLDVNPAFERITGHAHMAVIGKRVTELLPDIRDDDIDWIKEYGAIASGAPERQFESFTKSTGRWYRIHAYSPEPLHFATCFFDITDQKTAETALRDQAVALKERVKEMNLLVRFSHLTQDNTSSIPEILCKTATLIPQACQWPDLTTARIEFRGQHYSTSGYLDSPCSITTNININGEVCGSVIISIPGKPPREPDQAFLPEEESLLITLSFYIARFVERVEEQEARKLSETRSRTYLNSAPDGIFVVDSKGRFREVNPAGCSMLGYSEKEILGLSIPQILWPASAREGLLAFDTVREQGRDVRELELLRKDGSRVPVVIASVALPEDQYMSFCKDISARKRAEEKKELYFKAMDSIDQAVVITDTEGNIIELNRAFAELYGYSLDDSAGKTPRILNPGIEIYRNLGYSEDEYKSLFEGMWNAVKDPDCGTWKGVVINRRKDGALVWANLQLNAIYDKTCQIQYLIGLPFDISESRHREKLDKIELYSTIASLAELRDNETGNHMRRVGILAKLLAKNLGQPEKFCDDIEVFAPMHDIGKVGIADSILLAERKLSPEEWAEMQKHTVLGYNIVKGKKELDMVAAITLRHHERFDGTGYPGQLAGEDIPLSARITALIDVYDALRSERPYKKSWSHEAATTEIVSLSGSHFDPRVTECFKQLNATFAAVYGGLS
jgi:PAS domain S-box-containing protein